MTRCLPQTHRAYPKCTAAFHNCTVVCPNAGLHPSMTAQRPSQQPRSRRPPSPPSPRGPVPASADLPNPGFYGSGRFPSCCRVLALRLLQHGAAQCEAGAGGVAPVDPGRSRLPGLGAIALQARTHGTALIVDEPAFAQGVESLDHNGAPEHEESGPAPIG